MIVAFGHYQQPVGGLLIHVLVAFLYDRKNKNNLAFVFLHLRIELDPDSDEAEEI